MSGITYLVAVPANTGAFFSIQARSRCRGFTIVEDGAVVAQGLQYQYADGSSTPFSTTYTNAAGQAIQIGDSNATPNASFGPLIGQPPNPARGTQGTTLVNIRSLTGTATSVRVTETP
jgi:hypothetical protein